MCTNVYVVYTYNFHYIVATFTSPPMNVTVCTTVKTTAVFICIVETSSSSITGVTWNIMTDDLGLTSVVGRDRHMSNSNKSGNIINGTLTITGVSVSDNDAQYQCQVTNDIRSDITTLTVLGQIIIHVIYILGLSNNENYIIMIVKQ